jgi:hypothetical protein
MQAYNLIRAELLALYLDVGSVKPAPEDETGAIAAPLNEHTAAAIVELGKAA